MRSKTHNCRKPRRAGFSLLELLAVVVILGVIAAVVVPRISTSKAGAEDAVHAQNISEINSAIERYYFDNGSWPADAAAIGADADYFPDGLPSNPWDASKPYTLGANHRVVVTTRP